MANCIKVDVNTTHYRLANGMVNVDKDNIITPSDRFSPNTNIKGFKIPSPVADPWKKKVGVAPGIVTTLFWHSRLSKGDTWLETPVSLVRTHPFYKFSVSVSLSCICEEWGENHSTQEQLETKMHYHLPPPVLVGLNALMSCICWRHNHSISLIEIWICHVSNC